MFKCYRVLQFCTLTIFLFWTITTKFEVIYLNYVSRYLLMIVINFILQIVVNWYNNLLHYLFQSKIHNNTINRTIVNVILGKGSFSNFGPIKWNLLYMTVTKYENQTVVLGINVSKSKVDCFTILLLLGINHFYFDNKNSASIKKYITNHTPLQRNINFSRADYLFNY